ncbi:NAD(P)-binding protein [Peniophora sp. CONT]|nr:NAD(P)-binding protein [Peniophora sp. CONT]
MSPLVVLITGCSAGGIGFGLAEEFASKGCIVYASARSVEKMTGLSESVHRVRMDVNDDKSVAEAVKAVLEEQTRIDILVNNAGTSRVGPLLEIPLDHVEQVFQTNVFSILRVTQAVAPSMVARRSGLVINVGSVAGILPTPWSGTYSASKHAVHAITNVLQMELKPFNVKVMLLAPGGVVTKIATVSTEAFSLREDTVYKDYTEAIISRAMASHSLRGVLTVKEFSRKIVRAALKKSPPFMVSIAPPAGLFKILTWFPTFVVRAMFSWKLVWKNKSKTA